MAVVEEVWRDDVADVAAHVDLGIICQRLVRISRWFRTYDCASRSSLLRRGIHGRNRPSIDQGIGRERTGSEQERRKISGGIVECRDGDHKPND